jgi:putative NADH-flavin reductase
VLYYTNTITGLQLIEYVLRDSHTVVIYARTPSKLPESITSNPSVTVVKGELTERDALKQSLSGVHAVVSALGPSVKKGPLHPPGTPIAKGYALLLEVMRELGIKRLILLGTASMKDTHDKFDLQFWVLVNGVALFARNAYKVSATEKRSVVKEFDR